MITLLLTFVFLQQPETMSLLETPLYPPRLSSEERGAREAALTAARAAYERDRTSVDAAVAVSQADMALGHVGDALEVVSRALETKADDPRLLLERGRGLIAIRKFEPAARELKKSAETLPEASCALGMAQYLAADYPHARESFGKCADPGVFAYLAQLRIGPPPLPRPAVSREPVADPSAPIRMPGAATRPGPTKRLPMNALYLDAAERLNQGKTDAAKDLLKQIVEKDRDRWMDPVYIAAEVDYAKLVKADKKNQKKKKKK